MSREPKPRKQSKPKSKAKLKSAEQSSRLQIRAARKGSQESLTVATTSKPCAFGWLAHSRKSILRLFAEASLSNEANNQTLSWTIGSKPNVNSNKGCFSERRRPGRNPRHPWIKG